MPEKIIIDNHFIEKWQQKYDVHEKDEKEYNSIKDEVFNAGTVSEAILKRIYNWKAARAKSYVDWTRFADYEKVINQAISRPLENKEKIIDELDKLPGIGIPVASTILHFIHPRIFPIVDFRTIEVLQSAGYLDRVESYYHDSSSGYAEFRHIIIDIAQKYSRGDIRKVDKALFAYHKYGLKHKDECAQQKA